LALRFAPNGFRFSARITPPRRSARSRTTEASAHVHYLASALWPPRMRTIKDRLCAMAVSAVQDAELGNRKYSPPEEISITEHLY